MRIPGRVAGGLKTAAGQAVEEGSRREPAQQRTTAQPRDLLPLGDWVRHHSLRSWPVLLFLALICVPPIALVILGGNPSASTFDHVAWIFAAYFVGIPEELAKALPGDPMALSRRHRREPPSSAEVLQAGHWFARERPGRSRRRG